MLLATDGTLKISDFGVAEVLYIYALYLEEWQMSRQFYNLSDHNKDLEGHMNDPVEKRELIISGTP